MTERKSFHYTIIAHVTGWIIFIFLPILLSPHPEVTAYLREPNILLSLIFRNGLLIILFYFNLFYLAPIVLPKRGIAFFLVSIVASVTIVSISNWLIHENLTGYFGDMRPPEPPLRDFGPERGPRPPRLMLAGPMFSSFLITSMVAAISTLMVMWNNWTLAKENEQERSLQKVAAELSVLKLQISPHFLFNTLNNIRWLVRSKSDQAEEAVVKLSQLLRYILYQTNQEKVLLKNELEHLQDFIGLQLVRQSNKDSVRFTINGSIENQSIVPLLFIPIMENFFKYGNFDDAHDNEISLVVNGDHLIFKTSNKIAYSKEKPEQDASGIGLQNVKRRLALHYYDKHLLNFFEVNGYFKLEMDIILK